MSAAVNINKTDPLIVIGTTVILLGLWAVAIAIG